VRTNGRQAEGSEGLCAGVGDSAAVSDGAGGENPSSSAVCSLPDALPPLVGGGSRPAGGSSLGSRLLLTLLPRMPGLSGHARTGVSGGHLFAAGSPGAGGLVNGTTGLLRIPICRRGILEIERPLGLLVHAPSDQALFLSLLSPLFSVPLLMPEA